MSSTQGVCYIAFGDVYFEMACRSLASLRRFEPTLPVIMLVDGHTGTAAAPQDPNLRVDRLDVDRDQNRAVKTRLPDFAPFDRCLYLDADTLVLRPIWPVFKHLEAFDFCASFCGYCVNGVVGHLTAEDKAATLDVCPADSLHFQSGVFCWKRTPETLETFRLWHEEWQRFQKHDQGALARAVWRSRVRLGVLYRDEWNVLTPTLHGHKRLIHYADRKPKGLGHVFPDIDVDGAHEQGSPGAGAEDAFHDVVSGEADVARSVSPHRDRTEAAEPPDAGSKRRSPSAARAGTGVCYLAFGEDDYERAVRSVESLLSADSGLPVVILTDAPRSCPPAWEDLNVEIQSVDSEDPSGRLIQTQMPSHVAFDRCLVLPPDSLILQPVSPLFRHLESFDLCLAFDPRGVIREARHLSPKERARTFALCTDTFLYHEAGVVCWKRTESVLAFYRTWHREWRESLEHVEGALARAIWKSSVRIGVLWPGIWNHSRKSNELRILRGIDRFPEATGPSSLTSLVEQVMVMRRRERSRSRR